MPSCTSVVCIVWLPASSDKTTAQDKERAAASKSGGGGVEVFFPAFTSDMSVLDVLVHKVGARAAKIRLD